MMVCMCLKGMQIICDVCVSVCVCVCVCVDGAMAWCKYVCGIKAF